MADNTVIFPFPSTAEGSVVMFACEFGFRPQDVLSSVCGGNGQHQPDPGLHDNTFYGGFKHVSSDLAAMIQRWFVVTHHIGIGNRGLWGVKPP